jgi:hypothetical protein
MRRAAHFCWSRAELRDHCRATTRSQEEAFLYLLTIDTDRIDRLYPVRLSDVPIRTMVISTQMEGHVALCGADLHCARRELSADPKYKS